MLRSVVVSLLSLAMFAAPGSAAAGGDETTRRLQRQIEELTRQVESLRRQVEALRRQQAAPPPAPAGPQPRTPPTPGPETIPPPRIYGYFQSQFEDVNGDRSRFFIRRARIGVRGVLPEQFTYAAQIDASADRGILRDGFLERALSGGSALRFGQYKVPFALEGLESSSLTPTIERSFATDQIYHERDTGVQIQTPRDPGRWIQFAAGVFNGRGRNQFGPQAHKLVIGRLQLNTPASQPLLGGQLAVGLSAQAGESFNGASRRDEGEAFAVDAQYVRRRLTLRGEWLTGKRDGVRPQGWYALGIYRLTPTAEALVRYDTFDDDRPGTADARRATVGVNYYFSRLTRLMVNYEFISGSPPEAIRSGLRVRLQTLLP